MKSKLLLYAFTLLACTQLTAQNVGINNTNPQAALDLSGDLILRSTPLALVGGNNDNIDLSTTKSAHYTISGQTSTAIITGFSGGVDGRTVTLYNTSPFGMIIKHQEGASSSANQIHTGTGIDFTMSSYSTISLRYQANDNLWHILSTANDLNGPFVIDATGNAYNINTGNIGIGTAGGTIPQKFTVRQIGIGISQEGGAAGAQIGLYATSVSAYVQTHTAHDLLFATNNGSASMTLKNVTGNLQIGSTGSNARLSVTRGNSTSAFDGTAAFYGTTHISHFNYGTAEDTYIRGGKDNGRVFLADNAGGAVGIGTTNTAGYKLAVNGSARAKEVVVETGWADYVFDEAYKLKDLNEVENFIKQNKHLPNIPSASEIETNGLKVGETQKRMMEKIEELTLYIIQLKKEMDALKASINQQK
jgi:hypothetical protein